MDDEDDDEDFMLALSGSDLSSPEDIEEKDVFIDDLKHNFEKLKIEKKIKVHEQKKIIVEKDQGVTRAAEDKSESWESCDSQESSE